MLIKSLAFSLLAFAGYASAQTPVVVYDNLTSTTTYGTTSGSTVGMAFNTGSTALSLTDVVFPQLTTNTNASAVNTAETFSVYLRNSDGTVGTQVGLPALFTIYDNTVFDPGPDPSKPGYGQADASANLASGFPLLPNTSYYFSVTAPVGNTLIWNDVASTVPAQPAAATAYGAFLPSGTIAYSTNALGAVTPYTANPLVAQVYAIAVPEPSTVSILALAVGGTLLVVRRARGSKIG